MDQKAFLAITAMLNSFPQQAATDSETLLKTYSAVLKDISSQAVTEAAQRFVTGDVKNQSKTFPPSIAEFVEEARRRQEYIELASRPRLPAPTFRRGPLAPFEVKRQRALAEHSHRPILFEDVTHEKFRQLSHAKQLPVGASWVACLGIIYGPEPKQHREAA